MEDKLVKLETKISWYKFWLLKHGINDYELVVDGDNLLVNVTGDVYLKLNSMDGISVKFGRVGGNFDCSSSGLEDLIGCPTYVGGNFVCNNNKGVTDLTGCPSEIVGNFDCSHNELISLDGCAVIVGGHFDCSYNKLSSLESGPKKVGGDYDCCRNRSLSLQ